MIRAVVRLAGAFSAVLLASGSASAMTPPTLGPDAVPPAGSVGPVAPMAQRTECLYTGVVPGSDPALTSANRQAAVQFSRGEGQTVAVIDTGITPGPRLPNVEAGGDYVGSTDGLVDCDGHGTAVAGIIAGQPGDDGFSGVAPAVRLLSIRQTSAAYAPVDPGEDPEATRAAIDIASLARAVVHAADLGARVITISTATCLRADASIDQQTLGAALRYAAVDKDAVVVAAAGNTSPAEPFASTECGSNPITPTNDPADDRNWGAVTAVSVPSLWQPYVLSVASLSASAQPSAFTMAGPWVGIAAPGEGVVTIGNGPDAGLVNGFRGPRDQWTSLNGTGYAAAYVAGVAALVRSRFPALSAGDVIHRLQATAHNGPRDPSNTVGAGTVDPIAALTWEVLPPRDGQTEDAPRSIAAPTPPAQVNRSARTTAFVGTGLLAIAVGGATLLARRRKADSQ